LQIRESPIISIPNATLCLDDHLLSWNPWPLVDVSRFFSSSGRCPITGGYNIRLYDRKRQLGLCDAYDGETRLESECGGSLSAAAGGSSSNNRAANNSIGTDGMVFRFRYDSCVPTDLGMRTEQRTFCAVSWTIEDNAGGGRTTFIVLRHDSLERAWCFQYTTVDIRRSHSAEGSSQPDHFTALLFAGGLRCDVGQVGTNSTKEEYLKVDLSRDADDLYHRYGQRPVAADYNATLGFPDQLCVDDYEACSYWSEVCESQVSHFVVRTRV
jgi:hypothetical protein